MTPLQLAHPAIPPVKPPCHRMQQQGLVGGCPGSHHRSLPEQSLESHIIALKGALRGLQGQRGSSRKMLSRRGCRVGFCSPCWTLRGACYQNGPANCMYCCTADSLSWQAGSP